MPMRISKTKVLDFLMRCQIERGGYTGNDIAKLAKNIPLSPQALRKRINYRTSTDQTFNQLTYLGQRTISITLDDFILIDQRLKAGYRNTAPRCSPAVQDSKSRRLKVLM